MLKIEENVSLLPYNTFGIEAKSKYFARVCSNRELIEVLTQFKNTPTLLLGGGSNILLTHDFDGITVLLSSKGIAIQSENKKHAIVTVQSGVVWHDFVLWALNNNFGGIENLALIPGSVGAAPIQNIGAYGVELNAVVESCQTLNRKSLQRHEFSNKECQFGYRTSIFKTQLKDQHIITQVTFKLHKMPHSLECSYGAIEQVMEAKPKTIQSVAEAVIAIRKSKLPDPKTLGNSGSFFKNPELTNAQFTILQNQYPEVPHYIINPAQVKIPAGWLIEKAGLKGYRIGSVGVHDKQALVIVNYGKATGIEILQLSKHIQSEIKNKFDITLEPEVNII